LGSSRSGQRGPKGIRIRPSGSVRASRGFSLIEVLIVIVFIGLLAALATPIAGKLIRRSEDMAALTTVRQVLAVARLEAVKRTANVVVEISYVSTSDKRIRLHTFQDRANDTTSPLPTGEALAAGNCVQDTGTFPGSPATDEPTLGDVSLSPRIHFWKQGGSEDDITDAVRFNTYLDISGNLTPPCSTSTDRIIFQPGGGISPPQDSGSGLPTSTGGRGIYFADWQGKNFFRVTVESDLSGKARVDMYVAGSDYVTSGWKWQ
jgi:prepilin-type N-terminal cleavage/methylation domain-containing protein